VNLAEELCTVGMVTERELIRFVRTRARIASSFIQPVLFLFVLGYGMSSLVGTTAGFDFKKFVFPGIVAMTVMSTSISSAISIVWDREFGFLREMLVAPVSRSAIVLGKTLGGACIATVQGTIMLALAPLIGVRLTPLLVAQVIGIELLMAVALTAFGVFVGSHIRRMEDFSVVTQLLLFPMLFLPGALFPLKGLPAGSPSSPASTRSPTPSTRYATSSSSCRTCPRSPPSGSPPASPCSDTRCRPHWNSAAPACSPSCSSRSLSAASGSLNEQGAVTEGASPAKTGPRRSLPRPLLVSQPDQRAANHCLRQPL
jgi:daunorubicin resistance ABC transporter membrane protein